MIIDGGRPRALEAAMHTFAVEVYVEVSGVPFPEPHTIVATMQPAGRYSYPGEPGVSYCRAPRGPSTLIWSTDPGFETETHGSRFESKGSNRPVQLAPGVPMRPLGAPEDGMAENSQPVFDTDGWINSSCRSMSPSGRQRWDSCPEMPSFALATRGERMTNLVLGTVRSCSPYVLLVH